MVASCSAYGCTNRKSSSRKLVFHRFPFRDPELVLRWVIAMRRKNWWPSQYACICSDHFTDADYSNKSKSALKKFAVPSIFNFSPPKKKKYHLQRKVKAMSDADLINNPVSSEPIVIFLSDVQTDSTNDRSLDMKDSLNVPSQDSNAKTSNDSKENLSINQQTRRNATIIHMNYSAFNAFEHSSISGACSESTTSLPGSPEDQTALDNDDMMNSVLNFADDASVPGTSTTSFSGSPKDQTALDDDDMMNSVLNYVDDSSVPGTSDNFVKDTVVHMRQPSRRFGFIQSETDSTLNSVCDISISQAPNNTGKDISIPITHSVEKIVVRNTSDSRSKSVCEITDSNINCDTVDKMPLLINISGVCSVPKSDISVSVKQLTDKATATEKDAINLELNPSDSILSTEGGSRLNSVDDASLPSDCNDPSSHIPLVITISGICIRDLNAMGDISVSVKQLTERTNPDKSKQSAFKLKSVHDRLISVYGSDTMTDDSQ